MSHARSKSYNKNICSIEHQEEELIKAFEIEKERFESIDDLNLESAILLAESVEKELKRLVNDSKHFKKVRSKVGRYLINNVSKTISLLLSKNSMKNDDDNDSDLSGVQQVGTIKFQREFVDVVEIRKNQKDLPFEKIFTKNRIGNNVTQILIEDPYIITKDQTISLYFFIIAMKSIYDTLEYVEIKTKINPGRTKIFEELSQKFQEYTRSELIKKEREVARENLVSIQNKCKEKGINLSFTFGSSTMHDRRIFFNSGVVAYPGRGLSIHKLDFYKHDGNFNNVPCNECYIPMFRLKDWDIEIHNLSNFK